MSEERVFGEVKWFNAERGGKQPFVGEILRRNPSNSGEALTDNAEGNPERILKRNVQRLERRLVGPSGSKRGRP